MRRQTDTSHSRSFGRQGLFHSLPANVRVFFISNIAGHGDFEKRGVRLAELQAAGNLECVSGDTQSLARNFQENSVGGEEKQRNDMKPCRARLGLTGLPRAHIPVALQ